MTSLYCPQCGQQQISSETRFCSRCGLPLVAVAEVLTNNGMLPAPAGESAIKRPRSPRREGVRQGALMFLLGAVLVPMLAVILEYNGTSRFELLIPLAAIFFFLGGLMRMLYALVFQEGASRAGDPAQPSLWPTYNPSAAAPSVGAGARPTALPPAESQPVTAWRRRPDTAELVTPPSITENTTKLLNSDAAPTRNENAG